MNGFTCTRITATKPPALSKTYGLAPDGILKKSSGGNLIEGTAETVSVKNVSELKDIITGLGTNQALTYGIAEHKQARLVTAKALEATAPGDLPIIARTREFFTWPPGGGVFTLDFDNVSATTADDIFTLLVEIHPAFKTAPMVIFPSASSGLYHGETCLKPLNGWRALVLVADAQDIPRAGEALFKTAWLQGRGTIYISRSGAQLPRAPIDNSVWQPERLDFVSGAICQDGIEQRRPEPALYNKEAEPLDTVAIKTLTPVETLQFETLVKKAKTKTAPEAKEARDAWTETKIETECKKHPNVDPERITERIKRAAQYRYLELDYQLETVDGKPLTPEDILTHREDWHLKYIRDPFDAGARPRARVFTLTGGKPYIFAFSENKRYYLTYTRKAYEITGGGRVDVVEGLIKTAREAGNLFNRGGEVVTVSEASDIKPLDTTALQFVLDGLISFQKYDGRSQDLKSVDCPRPYAEGFNVSARLNGGLPELKGIVPHPTLDPASGRIIYKDGYDQETGLLLRLNGNEWPLIPEKPTNDDVRRALITLLDPFIFFPFAGAVDQGVYLAAILTGVIRGLLDTAPLFIITAPTPGTGKTLLSVCLGRIIGIKHPAMFPFGGINEEETRKRLLSIFRQGERIVILDNVTGVLSSESLCTALTNPDFTDRILGISMVIDAPTNALMVATGNNIRPGGELCRRVLTTRLDTKLEEPWKRTFDENVLERLDRDHVKMVAAALTVLKGTLESGFTMADGFGSFDDWNQTARAAVCYAASLGCDVKDPVNSIDVSLTDDPETGKLRALLTAWQAVFADEPTTVATAKAAAETKLDYSSNLRHPALFYALDEIAGERGNINTRRLGRWIERFRDRVIDGLFFQLTESKQDGVNHWVVRKNRTI